MRQQHLFLFALLASLVFSGCCSFERQWRNCQSYAQDADGLAGCWEGTWQSDYNGHTGGLRAVITKQDDENYYADFKATYFGIIPFRFQMPLNAQEVEGVTNFQGAVDLGFLAGGEYAYDGEANATDFAASYRAAKDHGTFTMSRPQNCVNCVE